MIETSAPCGCPPNPGQPHPLHPAVQDETLDVWKRLLELIEQTALDELDFFAPGKSLKEFGWNNVVTLPSTIGKLGSVQNLDLYGSSLFALPPEIGQMTSLKVFSPYTSYNLHWFPYEMVRCQRLKQSTVSTRAIYGNRKNRLSFPSLRRAGGNDASLSQFCPERCSVCQEGSVDISRARWLSLQVAADVLPLLVFACSKTCLDAAGNPPEGYPPTAHLGGQIRQAPRQWSSL